MASFQWRHHNCITENIKVTSQKLFHLGAPSKYYEKAVFFNSEQYLLVIPFPRYANSWKLPMFADVFESSVSRKRFCALKYF